MEIQKVLEQAGAVSGVPGEADLKLIHRFTRKELAADEVYVFSVKLCDNEVDRDGERFTTDCLRGLRELFIGKTGIFDHSGKSGDQVMRVYDAAVEADTGRLTSTGEPYAALCAKVYLLRSGENAALIRGIDAGIKKEVSVSCAVKRVTCSVCGKAFGMDGCAHKKGASYGGVKCPAVLDEPADAYEFSFVAVPAQPAAGVLKKRQGAGRKQDIQDAKIEELEKLAEDGRVYRAQLLEKTVKAGRAAMPELARELLDAMCGGLSTAQLREAHGTFRGKAAEKLPLCVQLGGTAKDTGNGYEGYRV